MKIALLMLEPPLPFGNAVARWYYVLYKQLVARGHDVKAFAACAKPDEIPKTAALFPAPVYELKLFSFPQRSGLSAKFETLRRPHSYMFSEELKQSFAAACVDADVVHMEVLWCGWLLQPQYRAKTLVNIHFLYQIDLAGEPVSSMWDRLLRIVRLRAEKRIIRRFQNLVTLSDRLRSAIQTIHPAGHVDIVPLGIDASLYDYIPDNRRVQRPTVTLIGNMGWAPSRSAAVRLLANLAPAIRQQIPDLRVVIVGWGARTALKEFLSEPATEIHENVPDTRPYFEEASVLLYAPSRGSGMKVKVLEALAFGVPVVTTSEGIEGLPADDGVHAGVSDSDAGLVERTVRLLSDPSAQNRQRAAGRQLLERHCGPTPTVDAVEKIYARILGKEAPHS